MSPRNTNASSAPESRPASARSGAASYRVLIATVTAGGGHLQAARALEEVWRQHRAGDVVQTVDLLDLVPRLQRQLYIGTYVNLVEHAPELWGMVFKKTDDSALVATLEPVSSSVRPGLQPAVRQCRRRVQSRRGRLHPLSSRGNHGPPQAARFPRPSPSAWSPTSRLIRSGWMRTWTFTASPPRPPESSLTARGADASSVAVTGIPIAPKFSAPLRRLALRKQLALRHDLPVLLVLSGGFGMGPVAEILDALKQISRPLQVLVVCGRNDELRAATRHARLPPCHSGARLCR